MKSKNVSIQIMQKFKTDTKEHHSKLESLPYFKALIAHKLPLEAYVNQLRGLSIVHSVLETEISIVENEIVSSVWDDSLRKLPLLEADIDFFKPRVISDENRVIDAALAMTEKFRLRRLENPVSLIGCLYVFEGSTLGNCMHRPDVSKTFHLIDLNGCHYYSSYNDKVQDHWKDFSISVNTALKDESLHDSVIEAAHETFSGLQTLYEVLYPIEIKKKSIHITQINPEAGNHPMPEDEREIQAALKTSQEAWDAFSFYAHYFGHRGKKFSDSDICWLVTLCKFDQKTVQKQMDWLIQYLAGRGMPSIMMEYTLHFLYKNLMSAVPEEKPEYKTIRLAAETLKNRRLKCIPEKMYQSLVNEFEIQVGKKLSQIFLNTGQLLVSALIDKQNGFEGSLPVLEKWYTDKECFSKEWIHAVNDTIQKVRSHLS